MTYKGPVYFHPVVGFNAVSFSQIIIHFIYTHIWYGPNNRDVEKFLNVLQGAYGCIKGLKYKCKYQAQDHTYYQSQQGIEKEFRWIIRKFRLCRSFYYA